MQTDTRLQDDPGLASRYLAGQLSPRELQAYEQHLLESPAAVRELEATARMKVGLANLRNTGRLERLLRVPPAPLSRWPALAAAAALIMIAVGYWHGVDAPPDTTLVATASELLDRSGRPLASGSSYALLRTRSSAYDAVIELPPDARAIELRVRPQMPAARYSIALSRIRPEGPVTEIGSVTELAGHPDGFVRLYVDSSRLEVGAYLLVVTPTQQRTPEATSTFRIRVADPEPPR